MIDFLTESVLSLADAAAICPARRAGKKPHVSCLYRWTKYGCKGVILESIQIGGTRCTSREALARFWEALTYGPDEPQRERTPTQQRRAAQAACRALEAAGA